MLKFRCQHCGQRIAVPSRHLGRLVTCSECGAQTHPLAEQIAAAAPAATSPKGGVAGESLAGTPARTPASTGRPTAAAAAPASCDNCGSPIGRLQASHDWNGHVVCGGCIQRLAVESAAAPPAARGHAPTAVEAPIAAPLNAMVTRARHEPASNYGPSAPIPKPFGLEIRERVLRALIVFVVASVALYGALSLLRDVAGLIAVAAVAVLTLLCLYALFRGAIAARRRATQSNDLAPLPRSAA